MLTKASYQCMEQCDQIWSYQGIASFFESITIIAKITILIFLCFSDKNPQQK